MAPHQPQARVRQAEAGAVTVLYLQCVDVANCGKIATEMLPPDYTEIRCKCGWRMRVVGCQP